MRTELGKIEQARFGLGGYQDACIGLHVTLSGQGWGVCDTKSSWDANLINRSENTQWTEEGRNDNYAETVRYISDLLAAAKVNDVAKLVGKPVQATFDGNTLQSWRILTEVL